MSVRNIVIGNYQITEPEPTTTSHHALTDLTNYDDHTQYWKIPGRSTDILTVPNTTDSTTASTGALVVSGGVGIGKSITCYGSITLSGSLLLSGAISSSSNITAYGTISSPNISSTGTISSARMTCSNAPINPNDVVRLQDIVIPQYGSYNGQWQDVSSSSAPQAVSIQYEVFGSRFTIYQRQNINVEGYTTLNYWLLGSPTPSIVIPSQYAPSVQQIFPILGTPNNSTPGNTVMALIVSTNGQILFEKLDETPFQGDTTPTNYISMNSWTASWYLN